MKIEDRFGKWTLGTSSLRKGDDPHRAFEAVAASSLTNLQNTNVYIVTHGWAPGWNAAVARAQSKILWWSTQAGVNPSNYGACNPKTQTCEWPSDFAWTPTNTTYGGRPFVISQSGLLPAIVANDPNALVLAYSWLDDSATDGTTETILLCGYESERYTNLNGLRLASGLLTILGKSFWDTSRGNSLHLIGHSHGSKVVTTAAWALQKNRLQVDQLTILDSPESLASRDDGVANLNWLYLADMSISTQPTKGQPQEIFVDNYVSEFDFPYTDFAALSGVVDVSLAPDKLYSSVADEHTYAATWYAGAAAEGRMLRPRVLIGLDWSPVLEPKYTAGLAHVYQQTWPQITPAGQIYLDPGSPSPGTTFSLARVVFSNARPSGTAQWDGARQELRFAPGGTGVLAIDFSCSSGFFDVYEGVAFDVELQNSATAQSQLVVGLGTTNYLVIDGEYNLNDSYRVSFNAGNHSSRLTFRSVAPGTSTGPPPWIIMKNFRCIELPE